MTYKQPMGPCMEEKKPNCCEFAVNVVGLCDLDQVQFSTSTLPNFKLDYNWTEISIPEVLTIPPQKPDVENIDKVLITAEVLCTKLIETPKYLQVITTTTIPTYAVDQNGFQIPLPNPEGTFLTGRKLLVEGILKQKIVYTADVAVQSVHSAHFDIPFSAYIIVYPKFLNAVGGVVNVDGAVVDVTEDFCVEACIEDVYIKALDERNIFKNVTLFLWAYPSYVC